MDLRDKSVVQLQHLCMEKDRELLDCKLLVELLYALYSKNELEPLSMEELEKIVFNMINTYQRYVDEESFECPF